MKVGFDDRDMEKLAANIVKGLARALESKMPQAGVNHTHIGKPPARKPGADASKALPRMLSIKQAAEYIGLAEKTLRNRISRTAKKPPPVKPKRIGGKVLFDRKDLDAFLDNLISDHR